MPNFWNRFKELEVKEIPRRKLKDKIRLGVPADQRVKLWKELGIEMNLELTKDSIMKTIGRKLPHVEYMPYLKNFIVVVNTLLTQEETLNFVASLIHSNLLLVNGEYTQMVNAALEQCGFNKNCERLFDSFFQNVRIQLKYRLIDSLLIEGPKILVKFCLAVLFFDEIPEKDEIFIKRLYSFKMSRKLLTKAKTSPYLPSHSPPDFPENGDIDDEDWMTIWHKIPFRFQLLQSHICFTTSVHGHSLSTLYSHAENKSPLIMIIKTLKDEVFGSYITEELIPNGINSGTGEMFVFSLYPSQNTYGYNSEALASDIFIKSTKQDIMIGSGPNGHAIWLNSSLTFGYTSFSNTFRNPPLTVKSYDFKDEEVLSSPKSAIKFEIQSLSLYHIQ
eukprot:NODE_61_length_25240_cov_0.547194.p8 type:complete len:389 gc:universal NODE_61_length_25240_cov_0.547194:3479-2313(-)